MFPLTVKPMHRCEVAASLKLTLRVALSRWATLHGSTGNVSSNRVRRAASVRYAGDDVSYYQSPASPEPFRHSTGLVNGDPLEKAARFPVVWRR